ncbi:MAG: NADH:flavin oxidoreductase, partial [Desulfovibrio sp.]
AFAKAAARAKAWGYDGVQLHAAHGYLLNQFLSPLTNQRMDEYGGPLPHRCRFLLDAYQAVRVAVGGAYPVMAKLTAGDNLDGGLVLNEAVYAGRELSAAGINALEISSGTPVSGKLTPARKKILKPEQEAYNLDVAGIIKSEVACPVMVVGGFRSLAKVRHAVEDKGIDFVSLSRPLIREPDLPKRWQEGDESPAKCISCNACFIPGIKEGGIYCMQEKKEQERAAKGEE